MRELNFFVVAALQRSRGNDLFVGLVEVSYREKVVHTQAEWPVMAGGNELPLNCWLPRGPSVFKGGLWGSPSLSRCSRRRKNGG